MDSVKISRTNRPGHTLVEMTVLDVAGKPDMYIRLYKNNRDIVWGFERFVNFPEKSKELTENDISEILHEYPNIFGGEASGTDA